MKCVVRMTQFSHIIEYILLGFLPLRQKLQESSETHHVHVRTLQISNGYLTPHQNSGVSFHRSHQGEVLETFNRFLVVEARLGAHIRVPRFASNRQEVHEQLR